MIVLDTHVWVWWVSGSRELSKTAAKRIEAAGAEGAVCLSAISAWEVAMLVSKGRLELAMDLDEWIARCEALPHLKFLPMDHRIALDATRLPGSLHADPADRIIVATARMMAAPLITRDRRLRRYRHVETVW